MTFGFRFTDVGEGLEEGEIVAWLVAVGDVVESYQPLVSVETDKSVVDLPSPTAGRVVALHGSPGDIVKVGELLVEIEPAEPATAAAPTAAPPVTTVPSTRVKASPATRKLAVELDVDLATVSATGPDGRVTVDDVRRTAAGAQPAPGFPPTRPPQPDFAAADRKLSVETTQVARVIAAAPPVTYGSQPLRGLRKRTAEVMTQSWTSIPHISAMDEFDATELLAARDRLRHIIGAQGPRITALSFAMKACGMALRRFPTMHSSIDMSAATFTLHDQLNIGLAVATDAGLVVPVLTDVGSQSLRSIATEIERLSAAARNRTLTPGELAGGTFTVTNYGSFGGTWGSPIIRPPEAGILGLGAIKLRPFILNGAVVARSTLPLVVAADHRLVDGDVLGNFLMFVGGLLSDPVRMLLED